MKTTEWIEINITVDPSGARSGLASLNRTLVSASALQAAGKGVKDAWGNFKAVLTGIADTMKAVGVAALATGAALMYVSRQAGDFEALAKAIEALEGGPAKAQSVMANLREIARAPGLGVAESIQGYAQLRRSGLAEDIVYRLVRELGNQNALAGGGKAELSGLIMVLTQIKNRGKLQTEEANQLAERGVPIYTMLEQAFGTRDPEAIAKRGLNAEDVIMGLLGVMEAGARVAAGAKNAHENMNDAIEQGIIAIGSGANAGGMVGALNSISSVVEKLINDGTLEQVGFYFGGVVERMIGPIEEFEGSMIYIMATTIDFAWKIENVLIPSIEALWGAFKPFWATDAGQKAMSFGTDIRQSFIDTWKMEAELRKRQRENRMADDAAKNGAPPVDPAQDRIVTATERTAVATERMAADLQTYIIGGGDRAARGWSRADRSDYSGLAIARRRGGPHAHTISAMGMLRFQPGN